MKITRFFIALLLMCYSFIANAQIIIDIQTTPAACAGSGTVEIMVNGLNSSSTGIQINLESDVNTVLRSHSGVLSNTNTYTHTFSSLNEGTYTLTVSEQMSGGNISDTQTVFSITREDNSIIVDKVVQSEACRATKVEVLLEKGVAVEYYVRLVDATTNTPSTTILSGIVTSTFEIDRSYYGKLVRVYAINSCGEEATLDFTVEEHLDSSGYFLGASNPKMISCNEMRLNPTISRRPPLKVRYPITLTVSTHGINNTFPSTTYSQTITEGQFTPLNIPIIIGRGTITYVMEDACGAIIKYDQYYDRAGYNLDTRFYRAISCDEVEAKFIFNYGTRRDFLPSFFPIEVLLEVGYNDPNEPTYTETYTINSNQEFNNYRKIPAKNHIGIIAKPKLTIRDACGNSAVFNKTLRNDISVYTYKNSCSQEYISMSIDNVFKNNLAVEFIEYPVGFDPADYHEDFTTGTYSKSFNSNYSVYLQFPQKGRIDSRVLPEGTYKIRTHVCDEFIDKTIVVEHGQQPNRLEYSVYTSCENGHGSLRFADGDRNVGRLENVQIVAAPASFVTEYGAIPYLIPQKYYSNNPNVIYMSSLPEGQYVFQATKVYNNCAATHSRTVTILKGTENHNFSMDLERNCNSFKIKSISGKANQYDGKVLLQRYIESANAWGHPKTGVYNLNDNSFSYGYSIESGNCILLGSNNSNFYSGNIGQEYPFVIYNYVKNKDIFGPTGKYRVVYAYKNYGDGGFDDYRNRIQCYKVLDTFNFVSGEIVLNDFFVYKCPSGNNILSVNISGSKEPIEYKIIKKNGIDVSSSNSWTQTPVFTNLDAGTYKIRAIDQCGNTKEFEFETNNKKSPTIVPQFICNGKKGSLYIPENKFLEIKWYENGILTNQTGNTYVFSPTFDVNIHASNTYSAVLTYKPQGTTYSCLEEVLDIDVNDYIQKVSAGTGQNVEIPYLNNTPTHINLFDYLDNNTSPTIADWGVWKSKGQYTTTITSVNKSTVTVDLSDFEIGKTYEFYYLLKGNCTNTDKAVVTIKAISHISKLEAINTEICYNEDAIFTIKGTPKAVVSYQFNNKKVKKVTLDTSGVALISETPSQIVNYGESITLYTLSIMNPITGLTNSITLSSTITTNKKVLLFGPNEVCVGGVIEILSSSTPATVNPYVSSNSSIASIFSNGTLTGLQAGELIVTYTSDKGCTATKTIKVYEGVQPAVLSITQPNCDEGFKKEGSVQITNYTSTLSYKIIKSGSITTEVSISDEGLLSGVLENINYSIIVFDGDCKSTASTFVLTNANSDCGNTTTPTCTSPAMANVLVTNPSCEKGIKKEGSIQITNYSPTLTYVFKKTGVITTEVSITENGILTGIYTNVSYEIVTSNRGCSATPTVFELIDDDLTCGTLVTPTCKALSMAVVSVVQPTCEGNNKQEGSVQIINYSPTLTYTFTKLGTPTTEVNINHNGMLTGVITNVSYAVVVNNEDCSVTPTVFELVDSGLTCGTVTPCTLVKPNVEVTLDCDNQIVYGQILNYDSSINYQISLKATIDINGKITGLSLDNSYILVASLNNCSEVLSFTATDTDADCTVICEGIKVPEGFSPNNDGDNDIFKIPCLAEKYPNFRIHIYNRWGNLVYKYTYRGIGDPQWWNGYSTQHMTMNKNNRLPVGTYFYIIESNDSRNRTYNGWIYLNY